MVSVDRPNYRRPPDCVTVVPTLAGCAATNNPFKPTNTIGDLSTTSVFIQITRDLYNRQ